MKTIASIFLMLSSFLYANAQKAPLSVIGDCGTPVPAVDILSIPGLPSRPPRQNEASQLIKLYVHIFRNDNGSNAACTQQQIEDEVRNFMNPDYGGANTCFAIVGFEFINNTHLNTACNVDSAADRQAVLAYDKNDCINIYCHQSGLKAYDSKKPGAYSGLNGSAYAIPSNHVSINIGNNILGGLRTLAHETGHSLGLYHTFERGHGDELVKGDANNRKNTGDKVSDTEADPYPDTYDKAPQISFAANCVFNGTAKDANNDVYTPPVTNTMSYYHHFSGNGCQRNQLTVGQFTRIDQVIGVTPYLQNTLAPSTLLLTNGFISNSEQRSAALNSITMGKVLFGDNYTLSGSHKAFIKSAQITLVAGTFLQPGNDGVVSLMATTCQ
jgi:hypothetical protein